MHKDRTISISVKPSNAGASFSMKYNSNLKTPLTVYAAKIKGYTYKGIYNSSGRRISSKTEYSFSPSNDSYTVKYSKQ